MLEALLCPEEQYWASEVWQKSIVGPDSPHDISFYVCASHLMHYSGTAEGLLKGKYKTEEGI
jgi:hypothetical protein